MSYTTESKLAPGTRVEDVRELVSLLGFAKVGAWTANELGRVEEYQFFDQKDYRSWSGVWLAIYRGDKRLLIVETRTPIGRSYHDLQRQNYTVSLLRRRFGGTFRTDEGRGRYLRPSGTPTPPPASGCHLAFHRFGSNLIKAHQYLAARQFRGNLVAGRDAPRFLLELDPRLLGNNTLIPYLVAAIEDYLKSTFIALLRYSPRKEIVLRNARLQGDDLVRGLTPDFLDT